MSRVTHLLIHRVTVYRLKETDMGHGQWKDAYVAIATNIRARISLGGTAERIVAAERKVYYGPVGYFEPTQDIAPQDVVVRNGVAHRVVGAIDPSVDHHRKMALEQIELAVLKL